MMEIWDISITGHCKISFWRDIVCTVLFLFPFSIYQSQHFVREKVFYQAFYLRNYSIRDSSS